MVGMQYEIESRRFKNDVNENIRYGWELEPTQSTMTFDQPQAQVYAEQQEQPYATSAIPQDDGMPFGAPTDDAPF